MLLISWIIFTVPACIILAKKNRGDGYYILAILFPLIGFIFALCLKKLGDKEETTAQTSFDITDSKNDQSK